MTRLFNDGEWFMVHQSATSKFVGKYGFVKSYNEDKGQYSVTIVLDTNGRDVKTEEHTIRISLMTPVKTIHEDIEESPQWIDFMIDCALMEKDEDEFMYLTNFKRGQAS